MKTIVALILSCASVFAADTNGVRVVSTVKTNVQAGSVTTTEVYTRNGQTNLVRSTRMKDGVVQIRVHRFYHGGSLVGDYVAMKDSSGFTTEAGCPYSVAVEFRPSKEVRSVVFGTNGVTLDAFMATNGVFSPADATLIRKANSFTEDLRPLFSPAHVTNTPPEDFGREVEQFIEKHKDK